MNVISFERKPGRESAAPQRRGFWHRFAQAIDSFAAYPVKHALSEQELRRVDDGIVRCRQLMFAKSQYVPAGVSRRLPVSHAMRMRRLAP
jgi:hypothetical protein